MDSQVSPPASLHLRLMALLIAILGGAAIVTMPVDIFPYIDIPIVSVVWHKRSCAGGDGGPHRLQLRARAHFPNVSGIEHIESQSHQSIAVVRIYFHPNVQIDLAPGPDRDPVPGGGPQHAARDVSRRKFSNMARPACPSCSSASAARTLNQQEILDLANNFVRTGLSIVQGATVSYPFGGKSRQIMVDLNQDELYAKQLSLHRRFQRA